MAQPAKTNAMRLLERAGVPYEMHTYQAADGEIDGLSVAHKTGTPPEKVFKTLVTRGRSGGIYVFVLPVAQELDMKLAAKACGEKSVEMVHVKELLALTGYVRGGCSPAGMKKQYPTWLDQAALQQETILVSGGKIGTQIEAAPQALAAAIGASFAPLCRES